jgi:drug/metabolite transporter, DME family
MTALTAAAHRAAFLQGSLLVLAAGMFWSFTGVLVRSAPVSDGWQYLGWRSVGAALFFWIYSRSTGRGSPVRNFIKLGAIGWLSTFAILMASLSYIFALKSTTVAATLFLSSCSPLLTGLLAWAILRERLDAVSLIAIAIGLAGVALMMLGKSDGSMTLFGNALALNSALMFGIYNVCLRSRQDLHFGPTFFVYALLAVAISVAATLINGKPLAPPPREIAIAVFNGFVFIGIGSALFIKGAAHVPAAGMAVLSQTESVFGPVWVALIIGEVPGPFAILGGALILGAVIAMAVHGARRAPPPGLVG